MPEIPHDFLFIKDETFFFGRVKLEHTQKVSKCHRATNYQQTQRQRKSLIRALPLLPRR